MKTITRVSKEFTLLRKEARKAKQIKVESYLESICASKSSLFKEICRKGQIVY